MQPESCAFFVAILEASFESISVIFRRQWVMQSPAYYYMSALSQPTVFCLLVGVAPKYIVEKSSEFVLIFW